MKKSDEKFSIYLVEDDEAVLKSLSALLESHGFETIPCKSAEQFLSVLEPNRKACLVLDLRLPEMSGMMLQSHLNEINARLPIIVVSAHGDIALAVQAMRAGAIDFIEKPAQADQLLEAINSAAGILFDRPAPGVPKKIVMDRLSKLTEREREVLGHLLLGKLNKEIAGDLAVSQRTIEGHRARIREKMHARGIADLIRMMG